MVEPGRSCRSYRVLITLVLETAVTIYRVPQPLPSVDYLRACFSYAPETGVLTWKERPESHFDSVGHHRRHLRMKAGKPAGSLGRAGYLAIRLSQGTFPAHRVAWAIHYGTWPEHSLDHINLNKSDNRICNLRDVSALVNGKGLTRSRRNTSQFTGVYWDKRSGTWMAAIRVDGILHNLGYYRDKSDAIAARLRANEKFGFSARHGQAKGYVSADTSPGRTLKTNRSGQPGVHLKGGRKWVAEITSDGSRKFLGYFETKEEAIAARKAAEIKYGVADRVSYGSGPAILQDPPT